MWTEGEDMLIVSPALFFSFSLPLSLSVSHTLGNRCRIGTTEEAAVLVLLSLGPSSGVCLPRKHRAEFKMGLGDSSSSDV